MIGVGDGVEELEAEAAAGVGVAWPVPAIGSAITANARRTVPRGRGVGAASAIAPWVLG